MHHIQTADTSWCRKYFAQVISSNGAGLVRVTVGFKTVRLESSRKINHKWYETKQIKEYMTITCKTAWLSSLGWKAVQTIWLQIENILNRRFYFSPLLETFHCLRPKRKCVQNNLTTIPS